MARENDPNNTRHEKISHQGLLLLTYTNPHSFRFTRYFLKYLVRSTAMIKQQSDQKTPALLECIFQGRTENKQVKKYTGKVHLLTPACFYENKIAEWDRKWPSSYLMSLGKSFEIILTLGLEWQRATQGETWWAEYPADLLALLRSWGRNKLSMWMEKKGRPCGWSKVDRETRRRWRPGDGDTWSHRLKEAVLILYLKQRKATQRPTLRIFP